MSRALSVLELGDLAELRLFDDDVIVISYSGQYEPFIGYTMAFNDPDRRAYIRTEAHVLTLIADALDRQGRYRPGGRVFIQKDCVCIKNEDLRSVVIMFLDWQGFDVVSAVQKEYYRLLEERARALGAGAARLEPDAN
jgi:hypothetical protein